jgi:hypothetical protein
VTIGRWRSRTPTRKGHIDPPTWGGRLDPGSTVQRRHEIAANEQRMREHNPQLQPGMIVILGRAPWRVVEIREKPQDLWPAGFEQRWTEDVEAWKRYGHGEEPQRATWRHRPFNVVVVPDGGGAEEHRIGPASYEWDVLPEHYAVCRSCGELPPCREEELDEATNRTMTETLRLMAIPAGACMGCGETISGRQKSLAFPGPNLWRPDLPDGTVRFHARGECYGWVRDYGEQWEAAGKPGFVSAVEQLAVGEGA